MKHRMTIGVVIPTYNRAALLAPTLDAVLSQILPADEIVIVDDESTDDTPAVLARYAAHRGVRIVRTSNRGDLAARNAGVRLCGTDIIAFCDSDDLWTRDHLVRMAALFAACPELTAAWADFRIVRGAAWEEATKFAAAPAGFWDGLENVPAAPGGGVFRAPIVGRLLGFQPFFPSAMVVRRQPFLARGGWDEAPGRILGGDFATALRIAEAAHVGVLHHPTVGIRKHADNRSGDGQRMNLGDAAVLEQALASRPALGPYAQAITASIIRRRRAAFDTAFTRRDYAAVEEILALIPASHRDRKMELKARVAALPGPLRSMVSRALLAAGTLRSRLDR